MHRIRHGLDLEDILNYPEKVEAITGEEVAAAARRFFSLDNLFIAVLDPEKRISPVASEAGTSEVGDDATSER